MKPACAALAAILVAAFAQEPGSPAPKPAEHIRWARTWESALLEASVRNVPIWMFVSDDA